MSEVKKIATRESYGNALIELGKEHENLVVLDADLAAATKTGMFKKVFPERHIDCGIAECDMIGIAAGIATTGMVPFASTFAMFAAGRAFEQVRNSVGYPHLNVKIGATHGGISVGEDGATHQCNEDIALMRTIPGMVVINPADDVEAKAAVEAAILHEGPVYLRFGRLAAPVINDRPDYKFEIGKGLTRPLVGMHFFNPADRMKLIEVIAGVNTPAETVETIKKISVEIGKTPVQVNEAAGFVVNRILIPMINEAAFIKMEGVSDIAGIDTAMKLGANHPMGPLELGDFIGLDICLAIMDVLYHETGDSKYRACPLIRKMVRGGNLGCKTGKGFYVYNADRTKTAVDAL